MAGTWITKILFILFSVGLAIGAFDHLRGNKWKLGERFLAGIRAFEPLFLTMVGIIVLIPFFRRVLIPVLVPLSERTGMDPGIFAGVFIANDMGAYPLAHSLASDPRIADFSGMLVGSVLGVNIVFTLPASLKMIAVPDREFLFKGMLCGFVTLPLGCFAGGLAAGYPAGFLLLPMIPICIVSAASILMLLLIPEKLTAILSVFGKGIEIVAVTGIVLAISADLTGFSCKGWMEPIQDGLRVICSIIIVLPGVYVLVELLNRLFRRAFLKIGERIGINEISVLGMITTLANSVPTFAMVKDMDRKGKLLNFAFMTGGAFAFGDHLAYCCAVSPQLAGPLLVTKLTAALSAAVLVLICENGKRDRISNGEKK